MRKWIDRGKQRMRRRGTVGAFRKQAQRAGMTTEEFTKHVLRNPKRFSKRTVARARLSQQFARFRKKRGES